jgi:TetR/AcrR family transcriptional regulator
MASGSSGTAAAPGTRRRRRGSELVINDLLDAALVEFAAHGFEAASTRAIAERAGAHQPQINYYFSSKEHLWRAAVDRLFALLGDAIDAPLQSVGATPDALVETFAEAIRRFVRFSAARPELNRVMNLEATSDSPRLAWIVDTHVRPRFALVTDGWDAIRSSGAGADLTGAEVFELLVGFGALPYANAPMLRRLGAGDPTDSAHVEAHAERLLALLLPERP